MFTKEDIQANDTVIGYLSQALNGYGGTVMISMAALVQYDSESHTIRIIRGGGGTTLIDQYGPGNISYLALEDCCQYTFMFSDFTSRDPITFEGNSFIDILNAYDESNPQSPYNRVVTLLQKHEVTEEQYNAALNKIKNDTIS